MPSFTICTAVYESGLRFFADYCRGLAAALQGSGGVQKLVLMADNLDVEVLQPWLSPLRDLAEITVARGHGSPAAIRRQMLTLAAQQDASAIACFDMDDIPLPAGLNLHGQALAGGDVSFGDLEMIDEHGHPLGRTFFAGCEVPDRVDDTAALLRRNFLGFSNTAFRLDRVAVTAEALPDGVVAADWWFFTMLVRQGSDAVKTAAPVVAYRSHGDSTLGGLPAGDCPGILERCAIIRKHYAHLMDLPGVAEQDRRVAALEDVLRSSGVLPSWATPAPSPGVWYDDVFAMVDARYGQT